MAANAGDASPRSSPELQSTYPYRQVSRNLANMVSETRASVQQSIANDPHHYERAARWNDIAFTFVGLRQQGGEEQLNEGEEEGAYDDTSGEATEQQQQQQHSVIVVSDDDGEDSVADPNETVEISDDVGETATRPINILGSGNSIHQFRQRNFRRLTSSLTDSDGNSEAASDNAVPNAYPCDIYQASLDEDEASGDEDDPSETTAYPSTEVENHAITHYLSNPADYNGDYEDSVSDIDSETAAGVPATDDEDGGSDSEGTLLSPPNYLIAFDDETGPTTPVHHTGDGSSSPLSDLPSTPAGPDAALRLIEWRARQRAKYGPLCECKGWCTCVKYKHFTSSVYHPQVRTVTAAEDNVDGEKVDEMEEEVYPLPSQTHLSEAVLAAWQPAVSGLRSTFGKGEGTKRRVDVVEAEEEETQAEYTWDRERPAGAPVNWEGDAWEDGRVKRVKRAAVDVAEEGGKEGVKTEEEGE